MNVNVLFFGALREATGAGQVSVELTEGASLDRLMEALGERLPARALAALRAENVRIAVDQTLVVPPVALTGDCEVAFLPPVTGG